MKALNYRNWISSTTVTVVVGICLFSFAMAANAAPIPPTITSLKYDVSHDFLQDLVLDDLEVVWTKVADAVDYKIRLYFTGAPDTLYDEFTIPRNNIIDLGNGGLKYMWVDYETNHPTPIPYPVDRIAMSSVDIGGDVSSLSAKAYISYSKGVIYGLASDNLGTHISDVKVHVIRHIYSHYGWSLIDYGDYYTDSNGMYYVVGISDNHDTGSGGMGYYQLDFSKNGYTDNLGTQIVLNFDYYPYVAVARKDIILIALPPVANFTFIQDRRDAPANVHFTDQSTGSVNGWSWKFGDGTTAPEQNPVHYYTGAGTYTVRLTVTGPGGSATETKSNCITLTPISGTLNGRVLDGATDGPLSGITVTLKPREYFYGGQDYTASTDSSGNYEITGILKYYYGTGGPSPIPYRICIALDGYEPYESQEMMFADGLSFLTHDVTIDPMYFNEVTSETNLSSYGSTAATFFDYDKDGDLDLYLIRHGYTNWRGNYRRYPNIFLSNNGDYTWQDVTAALGLGDMGFGVGCLVNDFDNDGDDDVYVLNSQWSGMSGLLRSPCAMYRNDGQGVFTDITANAGVGTDRTVSDAFTFDYDNDGKLDIFIVGCDYERTQGVVLYHNNGNGTFTDKTRDAGFNLFVGDQYYVDGRAHAAFGDFDNDNYMDIYVSNTNPSQRSEYYHNNGNGTFTEEAAEAGLDGTATGEVCTGDYDNNGYTDIFVVGNFDACGVNHLYHNNGDGTFTDKAEEYDLKDVRLRNDLAFIDFDNDGYLDLLDLGLRAHYPGGQPPNLYKNNVGAGFVDVSYFTGIRLKGGSAAFLDYDNDGYLDIYTGGEEHDYMGNVAYSEGALFQNALSANNWLKVELRGRRSNKDGIGAQIKVVTGPLTQTRTMTGTKGSGLSHFASNIFGLGNNAKVDYVEIKWPNGVTQRIDGSAITGHFLIVEENMPPELAPIGNKETCVGKYLFFIVSAKDADGDKMRFGVDNLPSGARLIRYNDSKYYFYWMPTSTQVGRFKVTFWVDDLDATGSPRNRTQEVITITVTPPPNRPPQMIYLYNCGNIILYWMGYDPEDGYNVQYAYRVDNGAWSSWSGTRYVYVSTLSRNLRIGWHTFQVKAKDKNGAESAIKTVSFYKR